MNGMKKEEKNNDTQNTNILSSDYDSAISLLNLYFAEWSRRDQMMYSQMFRFFYSILIIILTPNLMNYLQLDLPDFPKSIFRLSGLVFSLFFLYFNMGNIVRFKAISDTYKKIIDMLPDRYQRNGVGEYKYGRLFNISLCYVVSIVLFLCLFLLSIVLLIVDQ